MFRALIIAVVLSVSFNNCSTLLTKKDYKPSRESFEKWDIRGALKNFPRGEKDGFITTMEKTYLSLLAGKPDINALIEYSYKMDNQIRFRASRELSSFFYAETPEGYYASEHEIIWLHILLSWGYSMLGESGKAYTEAKICGNLLSNEWSEEGGFDDAFLRIILAAMWTMCGEWEEAQVDFRAAYKLDPSLKWARALADMSRPPGNLALVLGGPGPEPSWDPEMKSNPIRGFRGIKFYSTASKSSLVMKDSGTYSSKMYMTPDSSYWYERHFIRDNEIQDLIQDSHYATKAAGSGLKGTTITLAGITAGLLVATGGIALGAGIVVLGLYLNTSAEILYLGAIPAVAGCAGGYNIAKKSYNYSENEFKEDMDSSYSYRFVRFLPEYAWVGWSTEKLREPVTIYKDGKPLLISRPSNISSSVKIVSTGYYPDSSNTPGFSNPRRALGRADNPDQKDERGDTGLHAAIVNNNFNEVRTLVELGADVNATDKAGSTPLHAAVKFERIVIAEYLLKNGALANIKDSEDVAPLNTAIIFEQPAMAGLLVRYGADVNSKTKLGWSPLHNAVYCNNYDMCLILLKKGARVNEAINKGYKEYEAGSTPLKIAQINKNNKIIELLKGYGARN